MKSPAVILWLLVLAAVVALTAVRLAQRRAAPPAPESNVTARDVESLHWEVADFTLTDQDGQPFDTAQLRGKPWMASFFFAGCPGPCIRMNHAIRQLLADTPDVGAPVVSITVDPVNDTPERLAEYAKAMGGPLPRWRFLTGDSKEIVRIAESIFHVPAGTAAHSDRVILVGADGVVVGFFNPTDEADRGALVRKLRELQG